MITWQVSLVLDSDSARLSVMNKTWPRVLFYSLQMHLQGLAHARCHVHVCWTKNSPESMSQCYKAVCLFTAMQQAGLSGGVMLCLRDVQNFNHLCILPVLFYLVFHLNECLVIHSVVIHQKEI